jgi:hypothetical protein
VLWVSGRLGVDVWQGHRFDFLHGVQTCYEALLASYPMCTEIPSLGLNQWKSEIDHSTPSSANLRNMWSHTSTPTCHHGIVLSKYRHNFTLS